MKPGRRLVLGTAVAAVLLLFLFLTYGLNPVLESVLHRFLERELVVHSAGKGFSLGFESLDLDIYNRQLSLNRLAARPAGEADSSHLEQGFGELRIGRASIHGISLTNFLWNKELKIQSIVLDTLSIHLHKQADSIRISKGESPARSALTIDSVRLKGISAVELRQFEMDHFRLDVMESGSEDTLTSFYGDRLTASGIELAKKGELSYVPILDRMELELDKQDYMLSGGMYGLSFNKFRYVHRDRQIAIDSFLFMPLQDRQAFRSHFSQSYESYEARFHHLQIDGLDLVGFLEGGAFQADVLRIDSLDAEIYRDKTLPYNTERHVDLFDDQLIALKVPIRVDSLLLQNSSLLYYEELPGAKAYLEVAFPGMDARIANIRSGQLARESADTLTIDMRAMVRGAFPMNLHIGMPYASDAFWMDGHSEGHSRIQELNPVLFPSSGIRFTSGRLNGISFTASGSSRHMEGGLAMLYEDLRLEIIKDGEKRKTVSWLANALVKNSNPNFLGTTVVGVIEFDRTPYKGMWNFVWKGIQSGIENSLNALGKRRSARNPRLHRVREKLR